MAENVAWNYSWMNGGQSTAVAVAARGTVLQIAFDGAADAGELAADLVMAAGQKLHLNQRVAVKLLKDLVAQPRLFCRRITVVADIRLVLLLVA